MELFKITNDSIYKFNPYHYRLWIYVLKCKNGYYIGSTKNIIARLESHFGILTNNIIKSKTTTKLEPQYLYKLYGYKIYSSYKNDGYYLSGDSYETVLTLEFMKIYGVDKVYGGNFCSDKSRRYLNEIGVDHYLNPLPGKRGKILKKHQDHKEWYDLKLISFIDNFIRII